MRILISDNFDLNYKKNYEKVFLFNQRASFKDKNIINLISELEKEKILSKKSFLKIINNFFLDVKVLNKNLNSEILSGFLINNPISNKNIFFDNFLFELYQCLILHNFLINLKKKNQRLDIFVNKGISKSIFDIIEIIFQKENLVLKNRKKFITLELSFRNYKAILFHIKNNFTLKLWSAKRNININNILFIDQFNNFNNENYLSNIWKKLYQTIDLKNFTQLIVNSPNFFKTKNKNKFTLFLNQFNTLFLFINVFYLYIYYLFKINFNVSFNENKSFVHTILKKQLLKYTGVNLIKFIYDFKIFSKFFRLKEFKKVFILNENQSWEKILISIINNYQYKTKVYFYVHTPIRYWDLRYDYFYLNKLINIDNYSLCISSHNCRSLISDTNNVKFVEALRYEHLNRKFPFKNQKYKFSEFVVMGDIVKISTNSLLNTLNNFALINNVNLKIYFKPHPINKVDIKKYNNLDFVIINKYTSIYYKFIHIYPNYTTASLDSYLKNIPIIIFLDNKNFNLSPMIPFIEDKIYFHDISSLIELLQNFNFNLNYNKKFSFIFSQNYNSWKELVKND